MDGDSAPPAPTDRDVITDWSVIEAQVEPLLDRAHDVAHGIVGDAAVAADVVRGVLDSLRAGPIQALTGGDSRLESILLATRAAALRHTPSTDTPPTDAPSTDTPSAGVPRVPTASRNRVRLTQAAAIVLGADDTSTLELHLRHGIGADALAGVLGVSAADAPRRLTQLRSRLDDALAAFTLWRGGDPACPDLAHALADGTTLDPTPFDIVAFDAVVAHRATCTACSRLHQALTNPAGMLVAAPVVAVPPALRRLMLPTPATAAASFGAHRRSTDDTPTALLWAPVDRPAQTSPPVADAHRSSRWAAIAASAAALLLVVAGGVAIAVRGPSGDDRPATTAATPTDGPTDATEVRSLGPPPPAVATTGDTTSTRPPDTTGPVSTDPSNPANPNTEPDDTEPDDTETRSVTATTTRPRAPQGPAPRVAVTTAPLGPTTTGPDVDTGIPPLPPPPTTTPPTTTTTTAPTTTVVAATTTIAEPEPTTPEPTTAEPVTPEPTTPEPVPGP